MSADLRNRFAMATLLGAAVFLGGDFDPARAEAAETAIAVPGSNRTKLQLTVYPGNLAMIAEQRDARVPAGETTLRIGDLPETMIDDSFLMGAQRDADLVWTSLRHTANGPDLIARLLNDQVGKTVTIRREDGDLDDGTLISISSTALVQTDAGVEQVAFDKIIIDALPDGFAASPALEARIGTSTALDHLSMAYLLGGIDWSTAYVGNYDSTENRLSLSAMARVVNNTGTRFDDAQLRLVAGDLNRVTHAPMAKAARTEMMMTAMADSAGGSSEARREGFENLHVYGPFNAMTMADGDAVMLPLLATQTVPVTRHLVFQSYANPYNVGPNDPSTFMRPDLSIEIENAGGTDGQSPWPTGIVRIFGQADNGDTRFIGEDTLSLTPVGRKATLRLGQASDISGTRRVTAFDRKARPNLPDALNASFAWQIKNASDRNETVTIRENVPTDWEITDESHGHERTRPDLVSWNIDLPAGQEVTLSWAVRSTR